MDEGDEAATVPKPPPEKRQRQNDEAAESQFSVKKIKIEGPNQKEKFENQDIKVKLIREGRFISLQISCDAVIKKTLSFSREELEKHDDLGLKITIDSRQTVAGENILKRFTLSFATTEEVKGALEVIKRFAQKPNVQPLVKHIPLLGRAEPDLFLSITEPEVQKHLFLQRFYDSPGTSSRYYQFRKRLIEVRDGWSITRRWHAPMLVICQSSGHGKSKLMYEHAQRHLSSYLCLRDPTTNGGGFPLSSNLRGTMMESINDDRFDVFLSAYLLAICNRLESIVALAVGEVTEAAIAAEFSKTQPWLKTRVDEDGQIASFNAQVEESYNQMKEDGEFKALLELKPAVPYNSDNPGEERREPEPTVDPKHIYFQHLRDKFEKTLRRVLETTKAEMLTLVFDESNCLTSMTKTIDNKMVTYYRMMRRSFASVLYGLPVVTVFADTSSTIANYLLRAQEVTSSHRLGQYEEVKPFVGVFFIDHIPNNGDETIPPAQRKSLSKYVRTLRRYANRLYRGNQATSADPGFFEFIQQRRPCESFFLYGRSLWISSSLFPDVLNFATIKLIRGSSASAESNTLLHQSLAIIGSRTTLFDNYTLTNSETAAQLVQSFMATLLKISDDGSQLYFRYVSEPILAEAAADLMRSMNWHFGLAQLVEKLCEATSTATPAIKDTGEIGELVAEFILLAAQDFAVQESYEVKKLIEPSKPVTVEQFLVALVGPLNFKKCFGISKRISEGLVSFTHFRKMITDEKRVKRSVILTDFVGRCAAGKFPKNFPTADLFIPIVLKDGGVSCILVQVKNQADGLNTKTQQEKRVYFKQELVHLTAANVLQDESPQSDDSNPDQEPAKPANRQCSPEFDDYVSILMSIGSETRKGSSFQSLSFVSKKKIHEDTGRQGNHVLLYGLDELVYPNLTKQAIEVLKKLAKSSREVSLASLCQTDAYDFITTGTSRSSYLEPIYENEIWNEIEPIATGRLTIEA